MGEVTEVGSRRGGLGKEENKWRMRRGGGEEEEDGKRGGRRLEGEWRKRWR